MVDSKEVKPASVSSVRSNRTVVMRLSTAVWVGLVVVLLGLSFWGGVIYGHGSNDLTNGPGGTTNGPPRHHYAVGLVVYISQTSITISNEDNSVNQTLAITAKTVISINGIKSNADQIKPGNIVLIQVDKSDPTKANIILVNSHFSG